MAAAFHHVDRGMPKAPRNLARVDVTPDELLRFIQARGGLVWEFSGLPEDAHLRNIHYDFCTGTISLQVEHHSFPDVPPGEAIPRLPGRVWLVESGGEDDE